jgi:hypothetical protein
MRGVYTFICVNNMKSGGRFPWQINKRSRTKNDGHAFSNYFVYVYASHADPPTRAREKETDPNKHLHRIAPAVCAQSEWNVQINFKARGHRDGRELLIIGRQTLTSARPGSQLISEIETFIIQTAKRLSRARNSRHTMQNVKR